VSIVFVMIRSTMAPALVLLHGFTNTGASWNGVVAALAERYRPLAPDIRGHGTAAGRRPVTLEDVVDDVAGLTDGPFTLAGYSMGGRIALHVAVAHPRRVQRLILIGASPGLADPTERTARRRADEALAAEIEASTIEAFADRWAQSPVLAGQPAHVLAAVDADRRRNRPAGLAAALRGLGTGALPSLWERLPQLSVSTTLIVGERDEKFRATAAAMAEQLPQAEIHTVPDGGHAVHAEQPAAVAAIIAGTSR
jgi:2-succinyl-6-hydroxy-2,4-cyclohexadiene-1-carboxylate synthase